MHDDVDLVDLVTRANAGDKAAWDVLVERFAPLVWSVCRRYRLDTADAEDVGQTVWLRLVEHLPALRTPQALPGWLATTTQRECLRVLRIASHRDRQDAGVDAGAIPDALQQQVDQALLDDERDRALRLGLAQLPPVCRALLALLSRDPAPSYAEISTELGMRTGGIGPTRARCLDKLRRTPAVAALIGTRGGEERARRLVER